MAARRDHVAERRDLHDPSRGGDARRLEAPRELAEQRRSRREPHIPNPILEQIVDHFAS